MEYDYFVQKNIDLEFSYCVSIVLCPNISIYAFTEYYDNLIFSCIFHNMLTTFWY